MRAQRAGRRVLSRGPATAARVASPRASESKFELSRRPRRESSLRARQASTHRLLCARGPKPSSRPAAATQDLVTSPAPLIRFFEAGGLVSRGWQLSYSLDHDSRQLRRTRTLLAAMRAAPQKRRRPRFADAPALCTGVPRNVWQPSARWETSRIAAIGPRAARYGRSRPLLTLAPFTALRTRARVEKEYLPTHPWALVKTPARALRKWRATGVNQFADIPKAVWRPSRKDSPPGSLRSHGGLGKRTNIVTRHRRFVCTWRICSSR